MAGVEEVKPCWVKIMPNNYVVGSVYKINGYVAMHDDYDDLLYVSKDLSELVRFILTQRLDYLESLGEFGLDESKEISKIKAILDALSRNTVLIEMDC